LLRSLEFAKVGDYKVAYLDGVVQDAMAPMETESSASDAVVLDKPAPASTTDIEQLPYLVAGEESDRPGHDTVFVGDLVLSEFSRTLTEAGYLVRICLRGHHPILLGTRLTRVMVLVCSFYFFVCRWSYREECWFVIVAS